MTKHIIIVGGGQAGLQTIISLRNNGFAGAISLVCGEPYLPYQRPPLSKAYLSGQMARERLFLKPESFYTEQNITLYRQCEVSAIDTESKTITHTKGTLDYDVLVLATGSRPRPYPLQPPATQKKSAAQNIFSLRGIHDIDAMKPYFDSKKNPLIIGGGYIGLEAAAVSAASGAAPIVVEAAPRLLARVAEPEISAFYQRLHTQNGARIITDSTITALHTDTASGDITHITLADGETLAADFVIVGIGILPNIELAAAAGIATDNGILVDEYGCTNTADIYAVGDCTYHPNPILGRSLRLESVPNAIEQAKAVASHITLAPQPYAQVPWFWSDQYDIKLQIAGLPEVIDKKILRGDDSTHSFAWFYFTGDKLSGVVAVNRAAEFMAARQIMQKGLAIDSAKIPDETCRPKEWLS